MAGWPQRCPPSSALHTRPLVWLQDLCFVRQRPSNLVKGNEALTKKTTQKPPMLPHLCLTGTQRAQAKLEMAPPAGTLAHLSGCHPLKMGWPQEGRLLAPAANLAHLMEPRALHQTWSQQMINQAKMHALVKETKIDQEQSMRKPMQG